MGGGVLECVNLCGVKKRLPDFWLRVERLRDLERLGGGGVLECDNMCGVKKVTRLLVKSGKTKRSREVGGLSGVCQHVNIV